MKRHILSYIVCILIASTAFFIGRISTQKQYEKKIDEIINIYTGDSVEPEVSNYDVTVLSSENADIADVYGKQTDILSIAGPKKVFARFSATGCRPCIDTLTDALLKFSAENPDWHINLLIDNILQRDMYVLSKEFGPSFSLYSTGSAMADTGSDISPVMFRLTEDGKIFRHFTCSPDHPERTLNYTECISL